MSSIEVEARALLAPEQRSNILDYMRTLGGVEEISRVMIDFSGIDRQRTDVLRVNNGRQEFVTKTGGLADTVRRETKVLIDPQISLEQTLSDLATKGHAQGMLSFRRMFVAKTDALEYSVRDVLDQDTFERVSTLLDIEALNVTEGDEEAAKQKIYAAFAKHQISPLGKVEWTHWVKETYEQVDRPFHNSPENARLLESSLAKFR